MKIFIYLVFFLISSSLTMAQSQLNLPGININFGSGVNLVDTLELLVLFTLLSLAPAFIILTTSFTRIIVVFGFSEAGHWGTKYAAKPSAYWICNISFNFRHGPNGKEHVCQCH